jgi:hypothetical protein
MCLTGPNAVRTFSQYGASSDCGYRGKGGTTGVSVYSFQKGMIDVFFLQVYELHQSYLGSYLLMLDNYLPLKVLSDYSGLSSNIPNKMRLKNER